MPEEAVSAAGIDAATVLARYMFLPDHLVPADVALVFGATSWPRCLDVALGLLHAGWVRTLALSGGFNARLGCNEAEAMHAAALAAGVPARSLLMDCRSANTMENAAHTASLLRAAEHGQRVLPVTIHYHTRRVRLTLEHCAQGVQVVGSASYPSAFYAASDWQNSERGRRDVMSELLKIDRYFPCTLPPPVRAAGAVLRRLGEEGERLP